MFENQTVFFHDLYLYVYVEMFGVNIAKPG